MADYRSDEEQIELLRRWWRENGTGLLITIAVVVAGVIGWRSWQASKAEDQAEAAQIYESLVQALASDDSEAQETARYLADQLTAEHGDSGYVSLAALQLAAHAVKEGNYVTAEAELQRVIEADSQAALTELARLRLARVHYQQDRLDDALADLTQVTHPGLTALARELEGDVRKAQGDIDAAKVAYSAALAALDNPDEHPYLKQKLNAVTIR